MSLFTGTWVWIRVRVQGCERIFVCVGTRSESCVYLQGVPKTTVMYGFCVRVCVTTSEVNLRKPKR